MLAVLCIGLLSSFSAAPAHAGAVRPGFSTNTFSGNDDSYVGPVSIGFPIDLWGATYSTLYVNNNGNVTFDGGLYTYTPFPSVTAGVKIIAPFFADVDTRANSSPVTYGAGTVDGRPAFGVNWVNVNFYYAYSHSGNTNSFQLILIDRSDTGVGNFDIEFNYDKIVWETGDASGGSNGLGGSSVRSGYSNGTPAASFELLGSAVNGAFLDGNTVTGLIHNSRASSVLGRYVFAARNGAVLAYCGDGNSDPGEDCDDGNNVDGDGCSSACTIENQPPNASATGGGTYQINTSVSLGGQVSDFDGDTLTYEWLLAGVPVASGQIPTIAGGATVNLTPVAIGNLNLGLHTFTLQVSDGINPPVSSSIDVEIIDTIAPTLAPVADKALLWPPNHKMVNVTIISNAADNSGQPVSLTASVASNEPQDGLGDGDTPSDWSEPVASDGLITLQLRAERAGKGNGRIYTVTIVATDASGNSNTADIQISVPSDHGKKK